MDAYRAIETLGMSARFQSEGYSDIKRLEFWASLLNELKPRAVAEVGVFRGNFAQHILRNCESIEKYMMLDPWRHLDNWNKPANVSDEEFREVKQEAMAVTEFASHKRVILQGKTTDVSDEIPDESLDFAYIDGDHTLRGITIDLLRIWPKVKDGGILGGDDFFRSVWHAGPNFEPTVVFPLAVYFAEAIGATIYSLPSSQFAMVINRSAKGSYKFRDLVGSYGDLSLLAALADRGAKPHPGIAKRALRRIKKMVLPG